MTEIARTTTLLLEVVGTQTINVRATNLHAEVAARTTGTARVSFLRAETITKTTGPALVSSLVLEVLAKTGDPLPYVAPRNTLPWTIAPNWETGVTERLKWKTDVLASQNGTEQRRRLRSSPRREIEANYRTFARDRRFLDASLTGPGATLWQVPLWWDFYALTQPVGAGGNVLQADCRYGELAAGDTVMLLGSTPFIYELAVVSRIDLDLCKIILASRLQKAWPEATSVYNTRVCRLQEKQSATRKGSNAGDILLTFETTEVNDYPAYEPSYGILTEFRPNFANDLTVDYAHLYASFDNETGKTMRRDLGLRAFHIMQFEHITANRKEHDRFRGFLYYMQGKLRSLLVPTYSADMDLVPYTSIGAESDLIQVIAAGYTTYLQNEPDRTAIIFFFHDGTSLVRFITASVYTGADGHGNVIEAIRLDRPVDRPIRYQDVDKISFVQNMRQDQDDFEIMHETDSTGATKFNTTFRSVGPGRGSVPYALAFTGSYVQNNAPPQIPIDITKYTPPVDAPLKDPFYPEERWTPEVGSEGGPAGSGGNTAEDNGSGNFGGETGTAASGDPNSNGGTGGPI